MSKIIYSVVVEKIFTSAVALTICFLTTLLKALNAITAGIATKRPTAVATRASEIPAITTDGPPSGFSERSLNENNTYHCSEKTYKGCVVS